ncbi:MAG: alpha/beta fold hydrolase [Planctomycetota bacterium]
MNAVRPLCNVMATAIMAGLVGIQTRAAAEEMTVHDLSVKYVSSEDPNLELYYACIKTGLEPKPICAYLHGWHGNRYHLERDFATNQRMLDRYFMIAFDMRGRGSTGRQAWWGTPDPALQGKEGFASSGTPDVNGWELNDVIDAIEDAKKRFPGHVLADPVYVIGNSGGGGNTMGIVGKFPDYFAAAYADCGMCDYGKWAELTSWRESIERWVGYKLAEKPEAFRSRGGLTTIANRLTPIWLSHGDADTSVPIILSQLCVDANAALGKPVPFKVVPGGNHSAGWGDWDAVIKFNDLHPNPPALPEKGTLVVAGYLKTRRLEIVLPSIDSIADCDYDLSDGLSLKLTGGERGTLKVRLPGDVAVASVKATAGDKPVDVAARRWRDWNEWRFDYAGEATLSAISEK